MKDENLPYYWELIEAENFKDAHKWTKSAFGIFQHQVAGHKYVLHMLVKLPILAQCSAANPKLIEIPALRKWMSDLQRHKQTNEYKDAVRKSKPTQVSRNANPGGKKTPS